MKNPLETKKRGLGAKKLWAGVFVAVLGLTGCAGGPRPEPSAITGWNYRTKTEIALWGGGPNGRLAIQGKRPRGTVFTVVGEDRRGQVWGVTEGVPVMVRMPNLPQSGENFQWRRMTQNYRGGK